MEDAQRIYELERHRYPDKLQTWDSLSDDQKKAFWEGINPNRSPVDPRNFPRK